MHGPSRMLAIVVPDRTCLAVTSRAWDLWRRPVQRRGRAIHRRPVDHPACGSVEYGRREGLRVIEPGGTFLDKARESVTGARAEYESGRYNNAANRCYY